jgi:hypothetical protein
VSGWVDVLTVYRMNKESEGKSCTSYHCWWSHLSCQYRDVAINLYTFKLCYIKDKEINTRWLKYDRDKL